MYPLFALMLPDWWSMHYILNCSSYLKYRLRVSLRFNLSWHDFAANIKYGITDALSLWHKYNVITYTVVIHERLDTRVETRCPEGFSISCLASRSRHFSYSEIEFYFQVHVFVKFSSYHDQEILTGLFIHQPTVSNYDLIMRSVSLMSHDILKYICDNLNMHCDNKCIFKLSQIYFNMSCDT